jgi:hypothetical protein
MNVPAASLVDRLEATYSGAVFDVLREMGLPNQALPTSIRPLDLKMKLAGPVFTASGRLIEISEDDRYFVGVISFPRLLRIMSWSANRTTAASPIWESSRPRH